MKQGLVATPWMETESYPALLRWGFWSWLHYLTGLRRVPSC